MSEASYFIVLGTDAPGTAALRQQMRPAHRAWLRDHPGHEVTVLHGGPTLDAQGAMNGTVLIMEAATEQAVRAFLAADPYVQHGLFQRCEVRRWAWTLRSSAAPAPPR